jgi:uncharacterized membrane protein
LKLNVEVLMSQVLKIGVWISAAIIGFGWVLGIVKGRPTQALEAASQDPATHHLLAGLTDFQPDAWINLGLMVLIGIPVFRVGLAIVLFALEKDRIYVFISSLVFAILLFSIYLGKVI